MKIRFPILLACFMGSASFSSQVTRDIDNDSAASSTSTNGQEEVGQFHRSCLYVRDTQDNEGLIYAERNVADFYGTNKSNILKLYNNKVISEEQKEPDTEDQNILDAILRSETNIAFDAHRRASDLGRDLLYLLNIVFSKDRSYALRSDSFNDLEDFRRALWFVRELYAFVK